MYTLRFATGLLVLLSLSGVCQGQTDRTNLRYIERITSDFGYMMYPLHATYYKNYGFNDLLTVFSKEEQIANQEYAGQILDYIAEYIDREGLSDFDKVNYDVLIDQVATYVNGSAWAEYSSLTPMTLFEGIQRFAATMAITRTKGDFENYISRLKRIPKQVEEIKSFCRLAIAKDRTLHNVSIYPVLISLEYSVSEDVERSPYYIFYRLDDSNVDDLTEREDIRTRGKAAIVEVNKALTNLRKFLIKRYIPATRTALGVDSWDPEYYTACLKWHLSVDVTPEEIHELGLKEVRRITRLMKRTMRKLNFRGSIREFYQSLSDDPRFVTNDTDEVVQRYEDTIARIEEKIDEYFDDAPEYALRIIARPYGLFGSYSPVTETSPGRFNINTARPADHVFYAMMALSLHEAIPGHHMQFSYLLDTPLPEVRSNNVGARFDIPNTFPRYTAHVEGWGLYSEFLGEEMGLYADDYELMGRYSYEIFRASRLVVDTGLHYYGWTQQEAIDYMVERTAFSVETVEDEIVRYITWPGQATAYKYGEIFIRKLRTRAEKVLGEKFNIKAFHKIMLEYGKLPLSVMERLVQDWIKKTMNAA